MVKLFGLAVVEITVEVVGGVFVEEEEGLFFLCIVLVEIILVVGVFG